MIAFAITPGLAVMIGGFLSEYLNWISTFYASAIYVFYCYFYQRNYLKQKRI